jgi:peptidoglycan hydrolase-like protein with peptidoglycan-binding domain
MEVSLMLSFSPLDALSKSARPVSDTQLNEGAPTSQGQLASSLRGLSFEEGAAALAPPDNETSPQASEAQTSPAPPEAQVTPEPEAPSNEKTQAAPDVIAAVFAGIRAFEDALSGKAFMRPGCGDRAAVSVLQGVLQQLGHDCGPVDGLWGGRTTAALQSFQSSANLVPDAIIGPLTAGALNEQSGTRGQVPAGNLVGPDGSSPSTLGYNADERMEFDDQGNYLGTNTYDLDAEAAGWKDSDGLPWKGFMLSWDHEALLKRWSQVDKTKSTLTDRTRCQAQVAMAARIVAGPDPLTAYARDVKTELTNSMMILTMQVRMADPAGTGPEAKTLAELPTRLDSAIARLGGFSTRAQASYEDLDWIAEATRWALVGTVSAVPLQADAAKAHGLGLKGGDFTAMNTTVTSRPQLEGLLNALAPGESFSVGVDTNDVPEGQDSVATHSVTIGKDSSGKLYLYDPFPKVGDQFIDVSFSDEVRFWPYFEKQGPTAPHGFKEVVIDAKANASKQSGATPTNPWEVPGQNLPGLTIPGWDPNDPLGLGLGLSH